MPLVSIIMPNFNKEAYIHQAIESVLLQTHKNWELIIVDNGSTDQSLSIIQNYANKDKRIQYKIYSESKDSGSVRNQGLKISKGDFIAFLDSDDTWMYDKLEKQIVFMQENSADICTTHTQIINTRGEITGFYKPDVKWIRYKDLLIENYISTSATIMNRESCKKLVFPNYKYAQDYAGWLDLLRQGKRAIMCPETLISYRIDQKFYLFRKIPKAFYRWKIYRKYLNLSFLKSFKYFLYYCFTGLRKVRHCLKNSKKN